MRRKSKSKRGYLFDENTFGWSLKIRWRAGPGREQTLL